MQDEDPSTNCRAWEDSSCAYSGEATTTWCRVVDVDASAYLFCRHPWKTFAKLARFSTIPERPLTAWLGALRVTGDETEEPGAARELPPTSISPVQILVSDPRRAFWFEPCTSLVDVELVPRGACGHLSIDLDLRLFEPPLVFGRLRVLDDWCCCWFWLVVFALPLSFLPSVTLGKGTPASVPCKCTDAAAFPERFSGTELTPTWRCWCWFCEPEPGCSSCRVSGRMRRRSDETCWTNLPPQRQRKCMADIASEVSCRETWIGEVLGDVTEIQCAGSSRPLRTQGCRCGL